MLRRSVGREGLDEALLLLGPDRDHDLVGLEGRERIADRERHVRLARAGLDGLAGERVGGLLRDGLGSIERLLVVREPVEEALTHRRYDDLDRVGVADLRTDRIVRLLDGADDEDISGHEGKLLALPSARVGSMTGDRHAYVQEAELRLDAGADPAAVGAAVTTVLCGHWEHDGPCRWPHNNEIDSAAAVARFRTLFVAPAADEAEVRAKIGRALQDAPGCAVLRTGERPVSDAERPLAERLAATD